MTTAKDCFADNIRRLDPGLDPIQYNLSQGLRLLCEQLDRIERQQQDLESQMRALRQTQPHP